MYIILPDLLPGTGASVQVPGEVGEDGQCWRGQPQRHAQTQGEDLQETQQHEQELYRNHARSQWVSGVARLAQSLNMREYMGGGKGSRFLFEYVVNLRKRFIS